MKRILLVVITMLTMIACENTVNEYTITFDSQGGTEVDSVTIDENMNVDELEIPTKEGNTFLGWYLNDDFNDEFDLDETISENLILHSKWDINTYTIQYKDYDDTVLQSTEYEYSSDLSLDSAPIPSREGYTFDKWDIILPTTMPSNDLIITATYLTDGFNLSFLDYDGTVLRSETFDIGADISSVSEPIDPSREGYIFSGWNIALPTTMPSNDVLIMATYVSVHTQELNIDECYDEYEIIDDYIMLHNYCRWQDSFEMITIHKLSDPSFERTIQLDSSTYDIYDHEQIQISNDYIVFGAQDLSNDIFSVYIYNLLDESYERIIPMISPAIQDDSLYQKFDVSGDYLVVPDSNWTTWTNRIAVYKLSDQDYRKYIDGDGLFGFGNHIQLWNDYLVLGIYDIDYSNDVLTELHIYRLGESEPEFVRSIPIKIYEEDLNNYTSGFYLNKNFIVVHKTMYTGESYSAIDAYIYQIDDPEFYIDQSIPYHHMHTEFLIYDDYILTYSHEMGWIGVITGTYNINVYSRLIPYDKIISIEFEFAFDQDANIGIVDDYLFYPAYDEDHNTTMHITNLLQPNEERIIENSDNYVFTPHFVFSGDYIIIPSYKYTNEHTVGAIYIYKFSDLSYERIIILEDTEDQIYFGDFTHVVGNYIFTTSINNGYHGELFIYSLDDETFENSMSIEFNDGINYINRSMSTCEYYIVFVDKTMLIIKIPIEMYMLQFIDLDGEVVFSEQIPAGSYLDKILIPDDPQHEFYVFDGWDMELPNKMPSDDVVITAQFYYYNVYENLSTNIDVPSRYFTLDNYIICFDISYDEFLGRIIINEIENPDAERIIFGFDTQSGCFGCRWRIFDDYLVVSSNYSNEKGALFIYKLSDPTYERIIQGFDTIQGDDFGAEYLIVNKDDIGSDDDYIIVSAPNHNNSSGAVYIYKMNDDLYENKITAFDETEDMFFGISLNVINDYLFISNEELGTYIQSLYIYSFSDTNYERKVTSTSTIEVSYGYEYEIIGDYLLVRENIGGSPINSMYIYKLSDPSYERKIDGTYLEEEEEYQSSYISTSEYLILPSEVTHSDPGYAYIYRFDDEEYVRKILNNSIIVSGDIITARFWQNNIRYIVVYKFSDETFQRTIVNAPIFNINSDYIISNDFECYINDAPVLYRFSDDEYAQSLKPENFTESGCYHYVIEISGNYGAIRIQEQYDDTYLLYVFDINNPETMRKITIESYSDGHISEDVYYNIEDTRLVFYPRNDTVSDSPVIYIEDLENDNIQHKIYVTGVDISGIYNCYIISDYLVVSGYNIEGINITTIYLITDNSIVIEDVDTYGYQISGVQINDNYIILSYNYGRYDYSVRMFHIYSINLISK